MGERLAEVVDQIHSHAVMLELAGWLDRNISAADFLAGKTQAWTSLHNQKFAQFAAGFLGGRVGRQMEAGLDKPFSRVWWSAIEAPESIPLAGAHVFEWNGSRLEIAISPLPGGEKMGGSFLVAWVNAPGGGRCAAVSPEYATADWLAGKWGGRGIQREEVREVARVIVRRLRGVG